jgi:hypothetical protein
VSGGIEQRVWMHYRSLKRVRFKVTGYSDGLTKNGIVHGRMAAYTPNDVWLLLARRHRMPVRRIKDIVSARRGWRPEQ